MGRDRLHRMDRLLRLRQLDEEREATRLSGCARAHAEASGKAAEADAAVAAIGPWKARTDSASGLDLGQYQRALEIERHAMALASTARDQERAALDTLTTATGDYMRSASDLRVSENRRSRVERAVRYEEEIRESDQLADLLTASTMAAKP